jgi:integrase
MARYWRANMADRTQLTKRGTTASRPQGRRKAGDGAIIQRGDGRWIGRLQGADGRTKWYSGKDYATVAGKLQEALTLRDAGIALPDDKLTVGVWLEEWLTSLPFLTGRGKLRATTIHYYRQYLEAYVLRSELAHKPLAKLTPVDLEQLYRRMTADKRDGGMGLSTTTAHHLHSIIHRALVKAVSKGRIVRNVADAVDEDERPVIDRHEMHVLADADFDRFLDVIRGNRLEALFVVAIREGLRQGEILALHWHDVDLDGGALAVVGSLQGPRTKLVVGDPKTRKSRRRLELFPETVDALREHRARQREERLLVGTMWDDNDLVFPNEFGGFMRVDKVRTVLHALLRQAGLPDVRFHDLRHSAATDWLKHGMHQKVASERLGHASVAITLDLYSHVTATMQRDAVDAITRKRSAKQRDA